MAEDWAVDVRKYAPDADDAVIAAIVRHCGIALRSRDASLVSFTDPAETTLVRESYCRKKLGLTNSDEELDSAIASVGERMKADRTKNRVTVYYLLAELFGKLGIFGAASAAAAVPPMQQPAAQVPEPMAAMPVAAAPPPPPPPVAPVMAAAAAPMVAASAPAQQGGRDNGGMISTGLIALGVMGAIVLGTATVASLMDKGEKPAPVVQAAPIPVLPTIPTGSGVVAQEVTGKPQLSVYFDTASTEVSADFAAAAAPIKAWVDANPASRLAVSGYNDPRGDAAFNAELSKNRAQRVAAALAALGVPEGSIDLEKPPETTDADTSLENARRVDVIVKDGG